MKRKLQLFPVICVVLVYIAARTCRQLSGEDTPYQRREEKFRSFNCFDMRFGTISCIIRKGVKHYYLNRYYKFLEQNEENRPPLIEAFNMGPIVSSGLDYLEILCVGVTNKEEIAVATGSFIGAYVRGFPGIKDSPSEPSSVGRLRFVYGSIMGSWLGGRVGLMVYDICYGFDSLMHHYFRKGDVATHRWTNSKCHHQPSLSSSINQD